ncbi:MAG: T9SS type A sorting domain-containing protein [Draconibacterium sp.]
MKKFLFFLALTGGIVLVSCIFAGAQTKISFEYDASGNREVRKVIVLSKSAEIAAQSNQQEEVVVEDKLGNQEIRIYPNPTKGILKIDFPSLSETEAILNVYDLHGRLLIHKQAQEIGNELNLSSYPGGIYILNIHSGKEKREWKIIKE